MVEVRVIQMEVIMEKRNAGVFDVSGLRRPVLLEKCFWFLMGMNAVAALWYWTLK